MSQSQASQAFEQLHPKVQKWIWDKGWSELRDIQEQAIQALLGSLGDLILAAATASGKTEAVFIPLSSRLAQTPDLSGVRILYISPLKALINDQFARLGELFEILDIPVHRWHGDVSQHQKQRLLKHPSGILLITPESLEALFMRRGQTLPFVFSSLEAVVIDELHAFIGSERGCQLQSLLARLEIVLKKQVPRIGLSATLGDMQMAAAFLRPSSENDKPPFIIESHSSGALQLQIRGERSSKQTQSEHDDDDSEMLLHIYNHLRGQTNLIFANSRGRVESCTDGLNRLCSKYGVPEEFIAHHGSLSKELREDAESRLKEQGRPITAVCTSTLEMGIDIGQVQSVAQIGCPPSVSSLRQRLGRAGRRGEPAVLRMYIEEYSVDSMSDVMDRLHPKLVQACAMVSLLLQRWCEPPDAVRPHFSTFVQQILSLIVQYGGLRANTLWAILCEKGAFGHVTSADFVALLRGLGEHQLIYQMDDGTLLLDRKGEQLADHYSFYAAFQTPEEYRLVADGRTLGTLPVDFPIFPETVMIFAGKRWTVLNVDDKAKVIELRPSPSGVVPIFGGGGAMVHGKIREEMRKLYLSQDMPEYLNATARELLREARNHFYLLKLDTVQVIQEGKQVYVFPWVGDKESCVLTLQFKQSGFKQILDEGFAILIEKASLDEVKSAWAGIQAQPVNQAELLANMDLGHVNLQADKHDCFVPVELLKKEFVARYFDG